MSSENSFRILSVTDIKPAAQVLSQAFINDPLCAFMLPNLKTRTRTLVKFFRPYAEINIKNRRGFGVGEPLQGVAFWEAPEEELSISVKSLGKFLPLLLTRYPIGYFKARPILKYIDTMHSKYADEPHYYLDNIGVLPSARSQGFSSGLIRPFLALANERKVIAYTDTVTQANVPIYEHFGFQCLEEAQIAGTGITVWALRRSPQ